MTCRRSWCECGAAKGKREVSCRRCRHLDGRTRTEAAVIAALRVLGGRGTLEALRFESGLCERQVLRGVKTLVMQGRLLKLMAGEPTNWGERCGEGFPADFVWRG